MKVLLYMAVTPNGLIAKEDDDVSWVSKHSWKSYLDTVKKVGCVIIGRRTYELMPETEFIAGCRYIVFTHNRKLPKKSPDVHFTDKNPKSVLDALENEGIKEVCICGGGKLNGAFMKEKLVDELFLDVEPNVFGVGIPLFGAVRFDAKLELIDVKKLSRNELQLHYRVRR